MTVKLLSHFKDGEKEPLKSGNMWPGFAYHTKVQILNDMKTRSFAADKIPIQHF